MKNETQEKVPAWSFVGTVAVNVDNEKLSDAEFRAFVRRTLPVVNTDKHGMDEVLRNRMWDWMRRLGSLRCDMQGRATEGGQTKLELLNTIASEMKDMVSHD